MPYRDEDRLFIGCSDGTVAVFDLASQSMLASVSLSNMVPVSLACHQGVVLVGSGQGDVMLYDVILNPLSFLDLQGEETKKLEVRLYLRVL